MKKTLRDENGRGHTCSGMASDEANGFTSLLFLVASQAKSRAGVGCMQHFGDSGLVMHVVT